MKDVFVLPVSRHMGDLFNSKNPISDTRFCKFFSMEQCKKAEAARQAINNHDALIEALRVTANELNSYIEAENKRLKKNICSTDLDDPDYHDQQTVHEAFKLIHELTGKY